MIPSPNALSLVRPSNHGSLPDFEFDFLPVDPDDVQDASAAISQWELVNPSDADDSDYLSDFDYDHCLADVPVAAAEVNSPPSIHQHISGDANPDPGLEAEIPDSVFSGIVGAAADGNDYSNESDCDDDEEEEYDDGLDDELVPRLMRGKLGRERIRKLGKRGCSKMNTSKKPPFLYVKRGCLHGKHGFGIGLKNSL